MLDEIKCSNAGQPSSIKSKMIIISPSLDDLFQLVSCVFLFTE